MRGSVRRRINGDRLLLGRRCFFFLPHFPKPLSNGHSPRMATVPLARQASVSSRLSFSEISEVSSDSDSDEASHVAVALADIAVTQREKKQKQQQPQQPSSPTKDDAYSRQRSASGSESQTSSTTATLSALDDTIARDLGHVSYVCCCRCC